MQVVFIASPTAIGTTLYAIVLTVQFNILSHFATLLYTIIKMSDKKRSNIWQYFTSVDNGKARCDTCKKVDRHPI